jgi:hypothetical protein
MYALPGGDFYDVTSGSNQSSSATVGYDMVTGLGTPNANLIINNLVYGVSSPASVATPAAAKTTASDTFSTGGSPNKSSGGLHISGPFGPKFEAAQLFATAPASADASGLAPALAPAMPHSLAFAELAVKDVQDGRWASLSAAGQELAGTDAFAPPARDEATDACFRELADPPFSLPATQLSPLA